MRQFMGRVAGVAVAMALLAGRAHAEPAADGEEDSVRVFRDLQPSVVSLQNAEGSGTGIIIDASGLILTNAHVVISPLPFKCVADVAGHSGEMRQVEFRKVQVVGYHPRLDLALVRVDPKEAGGGALKPAVLAKTKPSPGQHIFVIGDPAGGGMVLSKTITAGMLSAVDREVEGERYDQIDAAINPGNSGGPVADRSGHVLGVVTFKFTDAQAIGFAIPTQDLKTGEFVPLAQKKGSPARAQEFVTLARRFVDMARTAGTPHIYRTRQPGFPGTRVVQQPGDEKARLLYTYYAAVCYRLALLHDPGNSELWFDVANTMSGIKEDEVAAAYMLRHIQLSPWGNPAAESYRELGIMLGNLKRPDDAITAIQEGIAKSPYNGRIWYDLALAQKSKGDDVEAAYSAGVAVVAGLSGLISNKATRFLADVRKNLPDAALKDIDARTASDVVRAKLDKLLADSNQARQRRTIYMTPPFAKYALANDGPMPPGVKQNIPQTALTATTVLGASGGIAAPGVRPGAQPPTPPLVSTPALDRLRDGQFTKPRTATAPTSYLKAISTPGDYIGQGQRYNYEGQPITAHSGPQGVEVDVGGWTLHFSAPRGKTLDAGEYAGAKRWPFNEDSPGLDFDGHGRGSNRVAGKFVVWELQIENGKVTRLAVDFLYHSEETGPPLYGMVRVNSSME